MCPICFGAFGRTIFLCPVCFGVFEQFASFYIWYICWYFPCSFQLWIYFLRPYRDLGNFFLNNFFVLLGTWRIFVEVFFSSLWGLRGLLLKHFLCPSGDLKNFCWNILVFIFIWTMYFHLRNFIVFLIWTMYIPLRNLIVFLIGTMYIHLRNFIIFLIGTMYIHLRNLIVFLIWMIILVFWGRNN